MPELRWTLLILGALFIGGLALWEWRRQRHARGPDGTSTSFTSAGGGAGAREGERISPTFDGDMHERAHAFDGAGGREGGRIAPSFDGVGGGRDGARVSLTFDDARHVSFADGSGAPSRGVFREPTLTFPEVSVEMPVDTRDRFADPPVVELDDESLDRLKVEAGEAVDEFSEPSEPGESVDDFSDDIEVPAPAQPMVPKLSPAAVAPTLPPADSGIAANRHGRTPSHTQSHGESPDTRNASRRGELHVELEAIDARENGAARDRHDEPTTKFEVGDETAGSGAESDDSADATPVGAAAAARAGATAGAVPSAAAPFNVDLDSLEPIEPIVDWPEEDTRKIVALRLVSGNGDRFAGRAVRLALAAEGFVLGRFDIFHKPGPDARAVLSAASLTKPGTFSLATMDAQRFGGISLFAVLPGPLAPLATFDELLTTARSLNDRLRGALQDERGEPLTPVRSANIRDSLTVSATAAAPVVGAAAAPPVVDSPDSTTPA